MRTGRWKNRLVTLAVALSLGVTVFLSTGLVPAAARRVVVVDPGPPGGVVRVITPARLRLYKGRIAVALRVRKQRFDAAAALLDARLARLETIAAEVADAGGNVTKVKDLISQSRSKLAEAKATEAKAVDAFEAVPTASDKRAAFRSALEIGRQAIQQLREARDLGRKAVVELRSIIDKLESDEGGSQ